MKYKLVYLIAFFCVVNIYAMDNQIDDDKLLSDYPFLSLKEDNFNTFSKILNKKYFGDMKGIWIDQFQDTEGTKTYLNTLPHVKQLLKKDAPSLKMALQKIDQLKKCTDTDIQKETQKIRKEYLYKSSFYLMASGASYLGLYASIQKEGILNSLSKIFKFIPSSIKNASLKLSFGGSSYLGFNGFIKPLYLIQKKAKII